MERSAKPTAAVLALVVALSLWGWALDPEHPSLWLLRAVFLPLLWAYIETVARAGSSVSPEILRLHRRILAAFGLFIATKAALGIALHLQVLPIASVPAARRTMGAVFGLLMAAWGNHLPKIASPWTIDEEPFNWQRVHRAIGWMATIGGLTIVAGWLLLPQAQAVRLQTGVVLGCVALAVVVKLSSVIGRARRTTAS